MNIPSKNIVSVFVLAYNQESFIAKTLESIINQKTNFPFNIVIGEDCSTDNTLNIIKEFSTKYPDKIKIITAHKNVGLIKNFIRTIKECDGKYIAICDGDDYWIDDQKLQDQVDFLENNSDFSIVFTNKNNQLGDGKIITPSAEKPDVSGFNELIKGNYIPSVTVLFKNSFYKKTLPNWLSKYPYGDWPIYLFTVNDGSKIKFLNRITANYRLDAGITASFRKQQSIVTFINLNILKDILKDSTFINNRKPIKESIVHHELELMQAFNKEGKLGKAIRIYLKLIFKVNSIELSKKFFYTLLKKY